MPGIVKVGAAQSGPIQKDEGRQAVVGRLLALMKEAHARGCDLVVFTELALTTFFPRYYADDRAEMDSWFETEMPGAATRPTISGIVGVARMIFGICVASSVP